MKTPPLSPPVGILRFNAGNTESVQRALTRLCIPSRIIDDPCDLERVSGVIFPGAGAAGSAMLTLRKNGWDAAIRAYSKPFLGICLGMQLLFDSSEENTTECLGIISGKVTELPGRVTKPHMGWNMLRPASAGWSDAGNRDQSGKTIGYAYFVHSYVCEPDDPALCTTTVQYGSLLCAGVRRGNFFGVQWHPEKSGDVGNRYLLSFCELCK
ncbi:MAG TPA: imidazole glycerol phosphate synthase subunit HisH [Candidatus Peribacteraceae bacterium]|nr:imidazole glycerol phosphate synthase subunit HisH [Candidatus Peribacteraceae bacterium]